MSLTQDGAVVSALAPQAQTAPFHPALVGFIGDSLRMHSMRNVSRLFSTFDFFSDKEALNRLNRQNLTTMALQGSFYPTDGNLSPNNKKVRIKHYDALAMIGAQMSRGQLGLKNNNVTVKRWEYLGSGNAFINYARFPTVLRYRSQQKQFTAPVSMIVGYSSFKPSENKNGQVGVLPHNAKWTEVKLQPNAGSNQTIQVFVDSVLVGDESCWLSILASLENSYPVNGTYIWFYPEVNDEYFAHGAIFGHPSNCKITGASLGMAVFAAVSGWAPVFYTGYIKYIQPGKVLSRPTFSREGVNVAAQYDVQQVFKQLNFVDTVRDIPMKIALALACGGVIIFPSSDEYMKPMNSFIGLENTRNDFRAMMKIFPSIYTMSMAQDGVPVLDPNGNNYAANWMFMGSTVTEFSVLSSLASLAAALVEYDDNPAMIGYHETDQTLNLLRGQRDAHQAEIKKRNEPFKEERKKVRESFAKKTITQETFNDDMLRIATQQKDQNKARAEKKKSEVKQAKAQFRAPKIANNDLLKTWINDRKETFESRAYTHGTAKQKAAIRKMWPSVAALRRIAKGKAIQMLMKDPNFIIARGGGRLSFAHHLRNRLVKTLKSNGIEDHNQIATLANSTFERHKTLMPIDENDVDDILKDKFVPREAEKPGEDEAAVDVSNLPTSKALVTRNNSGRNANDDDDANAMMQTKRPPLQQNNNNNQMVKWSPNNNNNAATAGPSSNNQKQVIPWTQQNQQPFPGMDSLDQIFGTQN